MLCRDELFAALLVIQHPSISSCVNTVTIGCYNAVLAVSVYRECGEVYC